MFDKSCGDDYATPHIVGRCSQPRPLIVNRGWLDRAIPADRPDGRPTPARGCPQDHPCIRRRSRGPHGRPWRHHRQLGRRHRSAGAPNWSPSMSVTRWSRRSRMRSPGIVLVVEDVPCRAFRARRRGGRDPLTARRAAGTSSAESAFWVVPTSTVSGSPVIEAKADAECWQTTRRATPGRAVPGARDREGDGPTTMSPRCRSMNAGKAPHDSWRARSGRSRRWHGAGEVASDVATVQIVGVRGGMAPISAAHRSASSSGS